MVVASALGRLGRGVFADCPLAEHFQQACQDRRLQWRQRLLPPLATLKLFILQVLHGNTSIAHLRQLSGIDFAPSSYCEARTRLPLEILTGLLSSLTQWARQTPGEADRLCQRIFIVDGSNFSMSDSTELHQHFHLPQHTKEGIGYPLANILGLLDYTTGLFVQMLCLPMFIHDSSAAVHLHECLQAGDILLGDRAFCSFAHFALLNSRRVFGCFRLHHVRKEQGGKGICRWHKPPVAPKWMSPRQFALLPEWLEVRLVSYRVSQAGFRSRRITLATTLMDQSLWPDEKLAELYGQRWRIEGCFNHLKTTMKMNVLRCQSISGVLKELAIYLLVYNLVRLMMLRAARQQQANIYRISFADALRYLACRALGLAGVPRLLLDPNRIDRWEPRVIRRRAKPYDLLTRPRAELKAIMQGELKC